MANNQEWKFETPECVVSNKYTPADKPEITYLTLEYIGGSQSVPVPKAAAETVEEGDTVIVRGVFTNREKKGQKRVQFTGHSVSRPGAGASSRSALKDPA